jgi:hypothetical protein
MSSYVQLGEVRTYDEEDGSGEPLPGAHTHRRRPRRLPRPGARHGGRRRQRAPHGAHPRPAPRAAAVVAAATGAMVDQTTAPATPAGYRQLLALANRHSGGRRPRRGGTRGSRALSATSVRL